MSTREREREREIERKREREKEIERLTFKRRKRVRFPNVGGMIEMWLDRRLRISNSIKSPNSLGTFRTSDFVIFSLLSAFSLPYVGKRVVTI